MLDWCVACKNFAWFEKLCRNGAGAPIEWSLAVLWGCLWFQLSSAVIIFMMMMMMMMFTARERHCTVHGLQLSVFTPHWCWAHPGHSAGSACFTAGAQHSTCCRGGGVWGVAASRLLLWWTAGAAASQQLWWGEGGDEEPWGQHTWLVVVLYVFCLFSCAPFSSFIELPGFDPFFRLLSGKTSDWFIQCIHRYFTVVFLTLPFSCPVEKSGLCVRWLWCCTSVGLYLYYLTYKQQWVMLWPGEG